MCYTLRAVLLSTSVARFHSLSLLTPIHTAVSQFLLWLVNFYVCFRRPFSFIAYRALLIHLHIHFLWVIHSLTHSLFFYHASLHVCFADPKVFYDLVVINKNSFFLVETSGCILIEADDSTLKNSSISTLFTQVHTIVNKMSNLSDYSSRLEILIYLICSIFNWSYDCCATDFYVYCSLRSYLCL